MAPPQLRCRSCVGSPRAPVPPTAVRFNLRLAGFRLRDRPPRWRRARVRWASAAGAPATAWDALWAMLVRFFIVLVASAVVAVANPSVMDALEITGYDTVIWAPSSYLLAYAVPLLLAGRLGDR